MSDERSSERVTRLLHRAAAGDRASAEALLPLVYAQLRAAAQAQLDADRPGQTLQATALVHEAFLRLVGPRAIPWQGRGHFYAAAAEAMRRILIDHARSRRARVARERAVSPATLESVADLAGADPEQIVAVDAALSRLEAEDPEAAGVVRLRFYAGLSVEQTAEALGISARTAARLWNYARAVMFRSLSSRG